MEGQEKNKTQQSNGRARERLDLAEQWKGKRKIRPSRAMEGQEKDET